MRTTRDWVLIVGLLLWPAVFGCGPRGSQHPTAKLAGTVSIDQQPVASGSITFMPESGNAGQPVTAIVQAGKYQAVEVPQGKVTAMFAATQPTGELDHSRTPPLPISKNIVPESARAGVPLTVTTDNLQQNFELTSP